MTRSIERRLLKYILICFSCIASNTLSAQSIDSFDASGRLTPSAESFAMTKYGQVSPSLYTGAMSFSLPIFDYHDPYFHIPISLEYNFDGYRPDKHSGVVGYGWSLNCGGVITREVRGFPDEGFVFQDQTRLGWAQTRSITYSDSGIRSSSYSLDVGPYGLDAQTSRVFTYDPMSDTPAYVTSAGVRCDPSPDLFHFSFCGYSGDFLMLEDGSIRVYNSSAPFGEFSVTLTPGVGSPNYAEIVIRTGDGTRYHFGGSIEAVETFHSTNTSTQTYPTHHAAYGYGTLDGSPTTSVTAFRLYEIEAPSTASHKVEFVYSSERQRERSVSEAYRSVNNYSYTYQTPSESTSYGGSMNVDGTCVGAAYYSPLESVKVDGATIVSLTYVNRESDEESAAYYNLSGINGFVLTAGIENECAYAKRLSKIKVTNNSGQTANECVLTPTYAPYGTPKMFLESVTDLVNGDHGFTYDLSLSLPKNDSKGTDHWGYWNGKTITSLRSIIKTGTSGYPMSDLYDQINGTWKDANSTYSKAGGMTVITYPTGGTTMIEYEGNTVGKRRTNSAYAATCTPYEVGGVRVKKLSHSAGTGGGMDDEVTYKYSETKTGPTSGILTRMPRYAVASSFSYSNSSASSELFSANGTIISYSAAYNGFNARDGHIGYTSVIEEYEDGSWKKYSFSSNAQTAYCDDSDYDEESIGKKVFTPYDAMEASVSTSFIRPVSVDRMNMRGQLLRTDLYTATGQTRETVQMSYSEDSFTLNSLYINIGRYYARTHWSARSPLLSSRTVTSYESDGSLSVTTNYTYNLRGQVTCESVVGGTVPGTVKNYYRYQADSYSNTDIPAARTAVVKTRTYGSTERIISKDTYTYSGKNAKPASHTQYHIKVPPVTTPSTVFTTSAGDGTSRLTSFSYDTSFKLSDVYLPGGATIEYKWSGNNVVLILEDGSKPTNLLWKDLVGVTQITEPGGQYTKYEYDNRNRLQKVRNSGNYLTTKYTYYLNHDSASSSTSGLGGDNYVAVDSYTTTAGTTSFKDVTYYNGLGYPEQEVMTDWAATGKKLVRPIVYDNMRRPDATRYLPYPVTASNGQMETGAVASVLSYYQSAFSDNRPYATTSFETTPQGRPLSVTKEGSGWENHAAAYGYVMNSTGDAVLKFSFTHNSSNPSVTRSGTCPQGTLLRSSFTDEDGREVRSFTDALGRLLCQRVVDAGGSGTHADTYYIYDLRDSLVCVIPPLGTKYLMDNSITSFSFSDSFASDHCFLWWRDGFGRPVGTSNPGGGRKDIEYNDRGLVKKTWSAAMSSSGFCRWLYYDSYGRITEDEYEDFDKSKQRGGTRHYYYYDYGGSGTDFGTAYAFAADAAAATSDRTTTMLKGFLKHETMTPVPGLDKSYDNTFTRGREYYYDKYGRVIQIVEVDSDGWKARYSTKYDFLGNVTKTVETHTTPGGVSTSLTTTYTRDKRGKVLTCARTIGGTTLATFTYNYNDLGLLGSRTTPSRSVESFTYDLHGWPKSYQAMSYNGGTIFSESLRYASPQKSGSVGLWSGMVSEYQSELYGSGGTAQTYDYFYDNASRLTNTAHYNGSALSSTNTEKDITYDLNGNISALKRYGTSLDDNLTFTYNGNRLSSVSDAVGGVSYTYTHDADGNLASDSRKGISVAYNVLGLPRTVTSGTTVLSHYEYLPDGSKLSALAGSGAGYKYRGSFVYSVDSSGNEKLESVACDEGRISVTYSGSGAASYRDDWHVRDYLGNTRLVVNITSASTPPSTGILEKSDYLPFGTRVATSSTPLNRWRQSGKEEQVIGGNDLGVLDFGARHYDPWLARWTTQDPMAGKYTSFTPYSYCAGNPVNFADPQGKDIRPKGEKELDMIKNTLPAEARPYVQLDNNGYIDRHILESYPGKSSNYESLLELVKSDMIIDVIMSSQFNYLDKYGITNSQIMSYSSPDEEFKDINIEMTDGLTTGESGLSGKVLFPDKAGLQNSTTDNIEIYINSSLTKVGAAETFSHEAYGHTYLYVISGGNRIISSHSFKNIGFGPYDSNFILVNRVLKSRRETINNISR